MSENQACEVPLLELLRGVPKDARAWYEHNSTSHSHIPYGHLCHKAADMIEQLEREADDLDLERKAEATAREAHFDE